MRKKIRLHIGRYSVYPSGSTITPVNKTPVTDPNEKFSHPNTTYENPADKVSEILPVQDIPGMYAAKPNLIYMWICYEKKNIAFVIIQSK